MQRKSRETLQAQTEQYAATLQESSDDQVDLLRYSAELAAIQDIRHIPEDTPPRIKELIQTHREAFVQFLKERDAEETKILEGYIKEYNANFAPAVTELKQQIKACKSREEIAQLPGYLGRGDNGAAFLVTIDGKKYAAKFPLNETTVRQVGDILTDTRPLIRARGVEHVAQLAAYSFQDGVTVMDLLPGKNVEALGKDREMSYSDQEISQLVKAILDLRDKGVQVDPKVSNFMYDPKEGFSVLDFTMYEGGYDIADSVMDLNLALSDSYTTKPNRKEKELASMLQLVGILKKDFPAIYEKVVKNNAEAKKKRRLEIFQAIEVANKNLADTLAYQLGGGTFEEDDLTPDDFRADVKRYEAEAALNPGGYVQVWGPDMQNPKVQELIGKLVEIGL